MKMLVSLRSAKNKPNQTQFAIYAAAESHYVDPKTAWAGELHFWWNFVIVFAAEVYYSGL
jgi:amino acid permease